MRFIRPVLVLSVVFLSTSSWAQQSITVSPSGVAIQNGPQAVRVPNAPPPPLEPVASTYSITGMARTETHWCAAGESVSVSGQGHQVTLTGDCRAVVVNGQGHHVSIEGVGSIEVSGIGNHLRWQYALYGRKPSVQSSGVGNSVKRRR